MDPNAVRASFIAILVAIAAGSTLRAADNACPAYPASVSSISISSLNSEAALLRYHRVHARAIPRQDADGQNVNFIDDFVFGKMAAAGIAPAPRADDAEALRRVTLDLTGRIPSPDQVLTYLQNSEGGKRAALIDSLMQSDAYVDHWVKFFGNLFQVTSTYYSYIGIPGRNQFHRYLQDFVRNDRSYATVARELISASGDSYASGPPNFLMRAIQYSQPIQDTWDEMTNRVTTLFLGVQTQCISCHDGRGHLESRDGIHQGINLWLSQRKRADFWRQSAFFSRLVIFEIPVDAYNRQQKEILTDRLVGGYNGVLDDPGNPGPRPARFGGPYDAQYLFNGAAPKTANWRSELAQLVAGDRQFARATVNYLWAELFRIGIVDPPNGWDLARLDPKNPPPDPWPLQPSHPELLEALADEFIQSGYSIRHMIRLMVDSRAYQLSSRYPGYPDSWNPIYARYFAKSLPRRLSAEEVYDAMVDATQTPTPMSVEGFSAPLTYAAQLPDPSEPRSDDDIKKMLAVFGRGDWNSQARDLKSNAVLVLYLMNDGEVNFRTLGNPWRTGSSRVSTLAASNVSDSDAIRQLCLATLGRLPTQDEISVAMRNKPSLRRDWLTNLQWVMLNQIEFLFNH